ncbi:rho GTPase-activating protein 20-like [Nannospalax galili]|uniref:rho GTPase-activating protein 20-like n=1 Tax=Nannospalax galili TaxID=1026970 RepID=UPI00111C7AE1|nr:rho GTPase-activating protein 20-like [Nannospalax galili]
MLFREPMASYNLSVCIAPAILWIPSSCNPTLTNEFSQTICLVEFILDNYSKVFGEDNDSIGQESAMICNSTETPPDTQSNFTDFEAAHAALDLENRSPSKNMGHSEYAPRKLTQWPGLHLLLRREAS